MTDHPNHDIPEAFKKHLEDLSEGYTRISRLLNIDLECSGEEMSPEVREQVRSLCDKLIRLAGITTNLAAKTKDLPN